MDAKEIITKLDVIYTKAIQTNEFNIALQALKFMYDVQKQEEGD